ncbi:MAG: hypothetical protein ACM3S1_08935 [Hyphomicrobiales bacterium]
MPEARQRSRSASHDDRSHRNEQRRASSSTGNNANAEEKKLLDQFGDQLSKSTQRAKWIHSGAEHADRKGQTLATRSHEVIQMWADARHAKPATVESTRRDDRPGVLRFDFPGGDSGRLKAIGWDQWFKTFDQRNLIFLYQETLRNGNDSNFYRFDNPGREDA